MWPLDLLHLKRANRFLWVLANPMSLRREARQTLTNFFRKHLAAYMSVHDVGYGSKPFAAVMVDSVKKQIEADV